MLREGGHFEKNDSERASAAFVLSVSTDVEAVCFCLLMIGRGSRVTADLINMRR